MSPINFGPRMMPAAPKLPGQATVQDRPGARGMDPGRALNRPGDDERRNGEVRQARRPAAKSQDPLHLKRDLFERPTIKLPAVQSFPARPGLAKAQPQGAPRQAPKAAKKPEATMLIAARDVQPGASVKPAPGTTAAAATKAPATQLPARPSAMEGLRLRSAELMGKMAGAASRALDGMELSAQLKRVQSPSALWNAAAKVVGAAGDAARGVASRLNLFAQGVQTAQKYAENGAKLPLPKGGAEAPAGGGAQDWRRAGAAFTTSDEMVRSLAVADDTGARKAAGALLPLLMDHAQRSPSGGADAMRAMRRVADAASALGQAGEPADAAQAARELRSAGKQVRQLFMEQGGGAPTLNTDQAATLQRLATVVRGGDAAADAFRRGSHRSLAAIGAEMATALSQGGDGQAAQAITLRDRTHALLNAQAGGNEADTVSAAKRLHVAIRQAQSGAQWERDRLLNTLARAA